MEAYWAGQGASCSAGPACGPRWSTSTTRRARSWPTTLHGGALDLWTVLAARRRRGCARSDIGYDDGGLALHGARRRASAPRAQRADRRVQRRQPARRDRRRCARWACRWPTRRGLRRADAGARAACSASQRRGAARRWWSTTPTRPTRWKGAARAAAAGAPQRGGRLWCVFGCGGNRDADQAPADGRHRRSGWPTAWSSPATTRAARAPSAILARSSPGLSRRDAVAGDRGPRAPRSREAVGSAGAARRRCCSPARATRTTRRSPACKHAVLRPGAKPRRRCARAERAHDA